MIPRSYNDWTADPDRAKIGVVPLEVAGVGFPPGVRGGSVHIVFEHLLERFHREVEPLVKGWCWGFAYRQNRNAANLSCHASGTAVDVNAPRHPNGKGGTFTPQQVRKIRKILADLDGVVRWGGDFGKPDEMHFEINGTPAQVAAVAARLSRPKPKPAPKPEEFTVMDAATRQYLDEKFEEIHQDVVTVLRGDKHPSLTRILTLLTKIAAKIGVKP